MTARGASLEAQNDAAEIALRAARRLGELSRDSPGAPGKRTDKPRTTVVQGSTKTELFPMPPTARKRFEAVASIPPEEFERHIKDTKKTNGWKNPGTYAWLLSEIRMFVAPPFSS